MFDHAGEDNWKGKAFADMELVAKFLLRPEEKPGAQKRWREGDVSGDPAGKRRRGNRGSGRGGGGGRGARAVGGKGGAWRAEKPCFSRLDRRYGVCYFPDCKFSHACASCGADHEAEACKKWDQAKVDQFVKSKGITMPHQRKQQ